jgi:hypothetical protein
MLCGFLHKNLSFFAGEKYFSITIQRAPSAADYTIFQLYDSYIILSFDVVSSSLIFQ